MKNALSLTFVVILSFNYSFCQYSLTAAIEIPEMQVFYEGIPIELYPQAIGEYTEIKLNIPNPYIAPEGSAGSNITVECTAKNSKGKEVSLGTRIFTVKRTPIPMIQWGGYKNGQSMQLITPQIQVLFDDNIPLLPGKFKFNVLNYSIVAAGFSGALEGDGEKLSDEHIKLLKNLPSGTKLAVSVKYSGVTNGIVSAMFEL